jgi:hypothetical protein
MRSSSERRACCKRTASNRDEECDDNQRRCKRERGPQTVGYSVALITVATRRLTARLALSIGSRNMVRAGGAGTGTVPGSFRWRRAKETSPTRGKLTPSRYAAGRHILVSRRGLDKGPIDDALELLGLQRQIVTIVRPRWGWLGPPT